MNEEQFRRLEELGVDLVELLGGDRALDSEAFRLIINEVGDVGPELHVDLLHMLTHRRFPSEQADDLWRGILAHKEQLAKLLGRQPNVRVAALDYLTHVRGIVTRPRLVDGQDFDQILRSVMTDELTGLYNRRHMLAAYRQEIRRARRYAKPLTVLMLDVDHFKRVNDQHGHAAGDRLLAAIGQLIHGVCRETDVVGRYGGDEFLVLLPETRRDNALSLAERLRRSAQEQPFEFEGEQIQYSLSMGLACYPDDSREAEELLRLADEALYASKSAGRDRVSSFEVRPRPAPRRELP